MKYPPALRVAVLTAAAHGSRLLAGFILLKFLALYLGAEGVGKLGHFITAATIMALLAGGGITNALIKYSAQYRHSTKLLLRFLRASATYVTLTSLVMICLWGVGAPLLASSMHLEKEFVPVIASMAIAQVMVAFTNQVIGVASGLGAPSVFAKVQIAACCLLIPIAWFLVANFGLLGV